MQGGVLLGLVKLLSGIQVEVVKHIAVPQKEICPTTGNMVGGNFSQGSVCVVSKVPMGKRQRYLRRSDEKVESSLWMRLDHGRDQAIQMEAGLVFSSCFDLSVEVPVVI